MDGRELSIALRSGECVYGTAVISTSPRWPALISKIGLDCVFLDTEHTPIDREKLAWMCQTYQALGLAPIVRIPRPDPYDATMVLDGGAAGIIAPYVESASEVQMLRGAVKMRPLKGKRLQKALTGEVRLEAAVDAYLASRNPNALIVMIESVPAIEALEDILSIVQLDAILIGPQDLSISLGIPEQYHHPLFDETVRTIIQKARSQEVGVGIHFSGDMDLEIAWVKAGANLIMHSSDIVTFSQTLARDFGILKRTLRNTA